MDTNLIDDAVSQAIQSFGGKAFSSLEFVNRFSEKFPDTWSKIVAKYGVGGRGGGKHYSSYSFLALNLNRRSRAGSLLKLDYRSAPDVWGSGLIRYWTEDRESNGGSVYFGELSDMQEVTEGILSRVIVNKYERSKVARQKCIEIHGLSCIACNMNFESCYGSHGAGFIHVHHIKPLSECGQSYQVDPKTDLVPLCPNCHAMVHYQSQMLSVEELKAKIAAAKKHGQRTS